MIDTAGLRATAVVVGGTLAAVGAAACWLLADPEPSSLVGAVTLAAVSLLVGLGGLPVLGARPSPIVVTVAAGVWGIGSVVGGWLQVAERAGISPLDVRGDQVTAGVESGLPVLVGVLGAAAVLCWVVAGFRTDPPESVVAVIAGVGVIAVSVTGHGGQSSWLPVVLGVHAVSAAWWFGSLGALVVTVRGRAGWARSLPEFSRRALPVVAALTVTGIVAAGAQLGVGPQLWETGYGRLLFAKSAGLVVLIAMAARHRRTWVPRAGRHAGTERASIVRAGCELAVLAAVLGIAAGLATTPPL
ncbi:copper resistance D family protein [Gordonia shandongensis]|uniref:copper resistance D family protein n=1 Tax=Gordonia shandongensis TaxID=376351 RepID=UPI0004035E8E|nr:CopD family protein [Gordonia shandongensis]